MEHEHQHYSLPYHPSPQVDPWLSHSQQYLHAAPPVPSPMQQNNHAYHSAGSYFPSPSPGPAQYISHSPTPSPAPLPTYLGHHQPYVGYDHQHHAPQMDSPVHFNRFEQHYSTDAYGVHGAAWPMQTGLPPPNTTQPYSTAYRSQPTPLPPSSSCPNGWVVQDSYTPNAYPPDALLQTHPASASTSYSAQATGGARLSIDDFGRSNYARRNSDTATLDQKQAGVLRATFSPTHQQRSHSVGDIQSLLPQTVAAVGSPSTPASSPYPYTPLPVLQSSPPGWGEPEAIGEGGESRSATVNGLPPPPPLAQTPSSVEDVHVRSVRAVRASGGSETSASRLEDMVEAAEVAQLAAEKTLPAAPPPPIPTEKLKRPSVRDIFPQLPPAGESGKATLSPSPSGEKPEVQPPSSPTRPKLCRSPDGLSSLEALLTRSASSQSVNRGARSSPTSSRPEAPSRPARDGVGALRAKSSLMDLSGLIDASSPPPSSRQVPLSGKASSPAGPRVSKAQPTSHRQRRPEDSHPVGDDRQGASDRMNGVPRAADAMNARSPAADLSKQQAAADAPSAAARRAISPKLPPFVPARSRAIPPSLSLSPQRAAPVRSASGGRSAEDERPRVSLEVGRDDDDEFRSAYDFKSARGGRGGIVTSVTSLWTGLVGDENSRPISSQKPNGPKAMVAGTGGHGRPPFVARGETRGAAAHADKGPSAAGFLNTTLARPTMARPTSLGNVADFDRAAGDLVGGQRKLHDLIRKFSQPPPAA
jgi:hypothetical protein